MSKERRKEAYKHSVFDMNMKSYIRDKLTSKQWSPEQIKGRCDLEGVVMVSVERIYQYIYWDQSQGGLLYTHLRTARRWRKKRLNRKHQKGQIPNRVMINQRTKNSRHQSSFWRLGSRYDYWKKSQISHTYFNRT